jgi:hypothetical protein
MTLFATLGFRNNTCSQWQTDKLGALLFSCVQVLFRPEKLQYCGADQKDESRIRATELASCGVFVSQRETHQPRFTVTGNRHQPRLKCVEPGFTILTQF